MNGGGLRGRVVIVDRDGTIVVDRNYLNHPAGLEFTPGAADGLRGLHEQGCRLVVVTNQSGVGRGLISRSQLDAIHEELRAMVRSIGAELEGIYVCPHTPRDECPCRKPKPLLLKKAAWELGFEPASAIVIGDKASDVEFGMRAGATAILLSQELSSQPPVACDFVARDFGVAADWILNRASRANLPNTAQFGKDSASSHG
jgi:D-glycero-D-manno-heptose 1,7-bisphosphate phosphatase